uniref:Retrotransposon gag domain-containing protein n=1 Tax=Salarias fasciatus TaxID=181472 RepID=A0A672FBX6_SALFA
GKIVLETTGELLQSGGPYGDAVMEQLQGLQEAVDSLGTRLKEAVDSTLCREEGLRAAMAKLGEELKEYVDASLQRMDRVVAACLQRRDEQWREELKQHEAKSRLSWRPTRSSTPAAPISTGPRPTTDVTLALPPVVPSTPPIRMEFPKFGESRSSADIVDFIEQCENFLTLRPLCDAELMGTLNAVLKGPARSWWLATRSKINTWVQFKKAFLEAFLPSDYQAEIEEQLRAHVQAPQQCLRDFAYDHRALCLKWRPDMGEGEIVHRILSACNPRLASGLRGTVSTVEQLVKGLLEPCTADTPAKEAWQEGGPRARTEHRSGPRDCCWRTVAPGGAHQYPRVERGLGAGFRMHILPDEALVMGGCEEGG